MNVAGVAPGTAAPGTAAPESAAPGTAAPGTAAMPNLADVVRARATIAGRIHRAPLVESPAPGACR